MAADQRRQFEELRKSVADLEREIREVIGPIRALPEQVMRLEAASKAAVEASRSVERAVEEARAQAVDQMRRMAEIVERQGRQAKKALEKAQQEFETLDLMRWLIPAGIATIVLLVGFLWMSWLTRTY